MREAHRVGKSNGLLDVYVREKIYITPSHLIFHAHKSCKIRTCNYIVFGLFIYLFVKFLVCLFIAQ